MNLEPWTVNLVANNAKEVKEHEEKETARLKEEKEWEEEFDGMNDEDFDGSDDGLMVEEERTTDKR